MKLAILFGSNSNEHDVSVVSASSIIQNLDKKKYDITPIYLDKENHFYKWLIDINDIQTLTIGTLPSKILEIKEPLTYLKKFDLVFLMVHGHNGEDGILSNIFDFFNIKYVGNKSLASIISMDKILSKQVLEYHGIKTSPYLCFYEYNNKYIYLNQELTFSTLIKKIEATLSYPLFVKPSQSGSSIGINKVNNQKELKKALKEALKIDSRILVETVINGRELECGLLEEKGKVIASTIGEVLTNQTFYNYDAKYQDKSSQTIIPASLPKELTQKIQHQAQKIFKILNLHGFSRCDFFLDNHQEIIFNEINTIPGFTTISMYPKLFANINIKYSKLLDIIIEEALNKKV